MFPYNSTPLNSNYKLHCYNQSIVTVMSATMQNCEHDNIMLHPCLIIQQKKEDKQLEPNSDHVSS